MAKNVFATFGILAVLLFGLGMVSAAVGDITLNLIDGVGSSSNKISGEAGSVQFFTIELEHTNDTIGEVSINWTGDESFFTNISSVTGTQNNGTIQNYTFEFTLPSSGEAYKEITAHFYNSTNPSQKFGTSGKQINYNVTSNGSSEIPGCTDEAANNYNSSATTDDGSCTYDATTSDNLCELNDHNETGHLEITDYEINNKDGDDDEWNYLDEIEITVDVENTDNDDIEDVEVRIAIYNDTIENGGVDVTNDFDFEDEVLDDIGRLKDDEEDSVTFAIKELPSEIEEATYYMYIIAYSDDIDECTSEMDGEEYFEFEVVSVDYEDSVVAKGSELKKQIDTYCGKQNLEITVPIYNLNDEDEEKVLVNLYNAELNIDEYFVIDDLNDGDKEIATFFIDVPSSLDKDSYNLKILVNFDWDDEMDEDDELAYEEQTSSESIKLNVLGCKAVSPTITATPTSTMEVGEELTIKALIKNNGDEADFTISLDGIEDWADLIDVTPIQATIKAGESQEVLITLLPKQSGNQIFAIETAANGEEYSQPVALKIAEKSGILGSLDLTETMWYLVAGIASLVVLILLVAIVKLSRRAKADF